MKNIFNHKNLNTGEVNLHYIEGPHNGHPIVLLAGQALSIESYKYVLEPLAQNFHVFAVDLRGHGDSSWTPGKYNFANMGNDIVLFIKEIIGSPTFISGNSSGGLVALWVAANYPEQVLGIILEDVPIFSAEWPRLRDKTWVYKLFKWNAQTIGSPQGRNLSKFFQKIEVPIEGKEKVIEFPGWIGSILAFIIRLYQLIFPNRPVDIPFMPPMIRLLTKSLSIYDPDFTKAFVDGSATENFDHSLALSNTKCPILLLHANWFETPENGLVGSMNDADIDRAKKLAPQIQYQKIVSGHMIHFEKPNEYLRFVKEFVSGVS